MRFLTVCLLALLIPLHAEESPERAPAEPTLDQPAADTKPAVKRLENGRLAIGQIEFDPETRRIRFPARINQTQGLLEFLLVHEKGKVHESLLNTTISATNLNVAFKLLRYKASRELYLKVEEDGSLSGEFEEATPEEKKKARIRIRIEWEDGGETKTVDAREWIVHAANEAPMNDAPWVYGGSFVYQGKFVAESSGSIVAIFLSNAALINFAGEDNENDDVWLPHASRVPGEATPVTVIIEPYES